jgi:hypothetical protein
MGTRPLIDAGSQDVAVLTRKSAAKTEFSP